MNNSPKDTKKDLRRWLAKRLGKDEVSDPLWKMLEDDHYIEEALENTSGKEELPKRAWQLQEFFMEMQEANHESETGLDSAKEKQRYVPTLDADDPMRQRAEAVSLYWAKVAEQDKALRRFRDKALNGGTISCEQAETLLTSRTAAMFSSDWFEDNDIPLIGHRTRVIRPDEQGGEDIPQNGIRLSVEWDGGDRLLLPLEGSEPTEILVDVRHMLAWSGSERPPITVRGAERPLTTIAKARRGSVLHELTQVALHLAGRFPWGQEEAARFVLTGEVVQVPPIYVDVTESVDNYPSMVRITASPWVPAEAVKSLYTETRKELKPAQTTSALRLAVFKFVMSRADVKMKEDMRTIAGPPWRRLMEAWNEQLPVDASWRYKDERNFYRDFYQALKQLAG